MNQILCILLDSAKYPIYIHDLDGTTVVNCVVGCVRKLQGITFTGASDLITATRTLNQLDH